MKPIFSLKTLAASACLAVLALGASGAAQAHGDNLSWSVGVSSPGVHVGVSNMPPVVMYPPAYPVYVAPRPVIYMPPAPVVYGPPGWRQDRGHHGHHGWHRGYGHQGHGGGHWERGHGHEGRRH